MQLKLKEIINAEPALQKLLETKMPVKVSYRLNRLANKLNPEIKIFYAKRVDLFKEYGEQPDPLVDSWSIKEKNVEKFTKELEEMTNIDIDVDFEPISLDDIPDLVIEPKDLVQWIFI